MEFGRIPIEELNKIKFELPGDSRETEEVLSTGDKTKQKVYLGCSKWGRSDWVGKLYPYGTKEKDFLKNYKDHYNCIEFNATHYKMYGASPIGKWQELVKGSEFLFCPKMNQAITHRGSLKGKNFLVSEFLRGVDGFKENLGPIFIQVSDNFSPKRSKEFYEFLDFLPKKEYKYFIELRHHSWFDDTKIKNELINKLVTRKLGLVITDTAGRRDVVHSSLTIPSAFIRFVAQGDHPSDRVRMEQWTKKIKDWLEKGIEEIYFMIHTHQVEMTPEIAQYAVDLLNEKCNLNLKPIKLI